MDENLPSIQPETPVQQEKPKPPAGLVILGLTNILIMGVLPLIAAIGYLSAYFTLAPKEFEALISQAIKIPNQNLSFSLTSGVFKKALIIQIIISFIFIISGAGVLARKQWGRAMVIYSSFVIVIIGFLIVLFNSLFVVPVILQVIYPAALILYFTNKNIGGYFSL